VDSLTNTNQYCILNHRHTLVTAVIRC
jgi:hypothetical protein